MMGGVTNVVGGARGLGVGGANFSCKGEFVKQGCELRLFGT